MSAGYTPLLSFEVNELESTLPGLLELGAVLDGPPAYVDHGKVP